MQARTWIMGLIAAACLGTGCSAGARVVRTAPNAVELEMWGPVVSAARHGREALIEYCHGGYAVSANGQRFGLGVAAQRSQGPEVNRSATREPSDTRYVSFRCKVGRTLARR